MVDGCNNVSSIKRIKLYCKMSVHRKNTEASQCVNQICKDMITCSFVNGQNDDMRVDFKGYLHNESGFILTAQNMQVISDSILTSWRYIIQKQGYECTMECDFNDGWVDVKCEKRRRSCVKAKYFYTASYLSSIAACIYFLWYRQHRTLPA